ncbi:MAG: hypothetical protein IJ680_06460 [Paludibacteraceae bacterium]|nr:hypothetical protein [Paludibacteraceae bacterium]
MKSFTATVNGSESTEVTANIADSKVTLALSTYTKEYALTLEPVAPYTTEGYAKFDYTETWIKNGYGNDNSKGWKLSRPLEEASNKRISEGKNRMYMFVGAGDTLRLYTASGIGNDRKVRISIDGEVKVESQNIGKWVEESNVHMDIVTNPAKPSMIEISNLSNGDAGFEAAEFIVEHLDSTDMTLSDLQVNGQTVTGFDPTKLTYDVELPYGSELPVLTATANRPYSIVTIKNTTTLPGSATAVVTCLKGTEQTYTVNFTVAEPAKSDDATLSDLQVNGQTVTGFSASLTTYNVTLAAGTTTATVTATTNDSKATVDINQAAALPGTATVTVTAENGTTQAYTVKIAVAEPAKSDDATLSDLQVNGQTVTGFSAALTTYNVTLAAGTTTATVTATANDSKATVDINQAATLPGTATVTVTAENGMTQAYTVNITVEEPLSSNADLSEIKVDGTDVTNFSADVTTYEVIVAPNATAANVTAVAADSKATVSITQATSVPGSATITVTAEDGTQKTYTVNIKHDNSGLSEHVIDGLLFDGRMLHNDMMLTLNIFDASGRLVLTTRESIIDLNGTVQGMFIVRSGNAVIKFVK